MGSIFHVFTNAIPDGTNTNLVRPSDWNSSHAYTLQDAVSLAGNTAGVLADVSSGRLILAGGNNITLSQNANSVTISGPNAGGAQTGISGIVGSNATYTSGTVTFTGVGGGITVQSNTGQRIDLSVAAPIAQTVQTLGLYVSSNTYLTSSGTQDARSLTFRGDKSITIGVSAGEVLFSVGAYLTTAMASNRGSDFVQAAAGFNGTNASGTIASNALSVSVAAPIPIGTAVKAVASIGSTGTITRYAPEDHQHAGVAAFAVTNTGNTLGNTRSQVGTFYLAASGGITASQSTAAAGNDTVWLSVAAPVAQTVQSAIKAFGASNTGNTAGNTGLSTGIDWVVAGSNNITISESTVGGGPNTLWISGPTVGGAQTGISGIQVSDTTYTSGTVTFRNANGISFGSSGANGVSASYTVPTQTNQTLGLYAVGNTTQNSSTTLDARTVSFNAINAMTVGFSNGSIQLSIPATSSLVGTNGITLSTNGSTISISANLLSQFDFFRPDNVLITNSVLGQSSLYLYPFDVAWPLSASRLNVFLSIGSTTSGVNSTGAGSFGVGYALYTRGTGASTDRISQLTSYSLPVWTYTFSSNTRFGVTQYIGLSNATSHSTSTFSSAATNVSTYVANSLGGYRAVALPIGLTLTPGRYWLGLSNQTTTVNTNGFALSASVLQQTNATVIAYRPFGTSSAASDASFYGAIMGQGTYSAQSAAWPNSIPLTSDSIRQPLTVVYPYANISGIGTNTNLL